MDLALQQPSSATVPVNVDMAPFLRPGAFRRARCITNGQLTPPPSPSDTHHKPVRSHTVPSFWRAKLLAKCPQTRMTSSNDAAQLSDQLGHSDSTYGSRSYHQEKNAGTLQHSPPSDSPTMTDPTYKHNKSAAVPSLELRRISYSYFDLRGLAHQYEEGHNPTLSATSSVHPPLLPSPFIDNHKMESEDNLATPFRFENPRHLAHFRDGSTYKSYDDMQILSCYEDIQDTPAERIGSDTEMASAVNKTPVLQPQDSSSASSTSNGRKKQPSPQSIESAESDWLANTTSHQQRSRKFRARCYQVVQHSFRANGPEYEDEEGKIMLATVLVGPGRPRLVQIPRPSSSNNSPRSSNVPSTRSVQTSELDSIQNQAPPSTPVYQRREISAFSPYDTPSINTPFTDISCRSHNHIRLPVEQTPLSASKLNLIPEPLSISRRVSSGSDGTMFSSTERRFRALARNFSCSPPAAHAGRMLSRSTTTTTWHASDIHHSDVKPNNPAGLVSRRQSLQRKLDAITMAIDEFPNIVLDLNSPVMIDIRGSSTEEKNNKHLDTLSRVFANIPKESLSMLAAWIIVDSYVSSLHPGWNGSNTQHITSHSLLPSCKPPIPDRSVSVGACIQKPKPRYAPTYSLFPLPPKMLINSKTCPDLDEPEARSQKSPYSIPSKACSILGIDEDQARRSDEQLLLTRIKALSISIGVIAQKLMEALKGESGWDPHLWRALAIVIGMNEENFNGEGQHRKNSDS